MKDIASIVDSYVAVWNEGAPATRRQRIREVWALDGTTCYRLMDARGYDAIEQRVVGSWEKWLSEGKHVFRPKSFAVHHNIIKLDFVMSGGPAQTHRGRTPAVHIARDATQGAHHTFAAVGGGQRAPQSRRK